MDADVSISESKLREQILADGHDDCFGLYEIIWSLNGEYPDAMHEQRVRAARAVIRELLNDGRVALYTAVWASEHYEPMDREAALRAIASPEAWEDPRGGPYIAYSAA